MATEKTRAGGDPRPAERERERSQGEMIAWIDGQDYEGLLRRHRFAPPGDPYFQGETGEHYARTMAERRAELPDGGAVASKRVGWSG